MPADHGERVLVAVDCANETRIVDPALLEQAPLSVNIDHHHDNTRFADVNLVVARGVLDGRAPGRHLRARSASR